MRLRAKVVVAVNEGILEKRLDAVFAGIEPVDIVDVKLAQSAAPYGQYNYHANYTAVVLYRSKS